MIVQAACRISIPGVSEIQIVPLHRHGDIGRIFKAFGFKPGNCKIVEQGFLDEKGNFYSRKVAAQYMIDHGQKIRLEDFPAEELYSEDLY